jgi:hypothetical protein
MNRHDLQGLEVLMIILIIIISACVAFEIDYMKMIPYCKVDFRCNGVVVSPRNSISKTKASYSST